MNIQAEKIELTKLLLNTDNPKIIQSIRAVFNKAESVDFWDELSFEQQQEIEQGSKEIVAERMVDYEVLMAKHR